MAHALTDYCALANHQKLDSLEQLATHAQRSQDLALHGDAQRHVHSDQRVHHAIGLGGEVGEVLNEIKKLERDDNNMLSNQRREKIIIELGDVMWYLTGICNRLNCSIEDVLKNNIEKLTK